jgi:hypothetical protein
MTIVTQTAKEILQVVSSQLAAVHGQQLSTVKNLPSQFPLLDLTTAAIQGQIFKSQDRFDSKGRKIAGNGLAATGAIIRRGRKVLIDVERYGAWLTGGCNEKPGQLPSINRVGGEHE